MVTGDLFRAGIIAPWYLMPFQIGPYQTAKDNRFPFIEQSRRTGKTNEVLVLVLELLIKNPGWVWRWCEPWKYQAREIVMPEVDNIQKWAHEGDKFRWRMTDSYYIHPNGSRLYLRGVNEDKGESARGSFAHGITLDEYGSLKEPKYIVSEVLLPQLLSTSGQLIKCSTPPSDLGHLYYEDKKRAIADHRFCQRTIEDARGQLYDDIQIDELAEEVGGKDSVAWKREFLCEEIGDPTRVVIPEFSSRISDIVVSKIDRPSHYDAYVGGDSGLDDNTFALFGFYDFSRGKVVIEREYCKNEQTTGEHVQAWKEIEKELWGEVGPYKRVLDADKQKIYDIMVDENYTVSRPYKAHRLASINGLREVVRKLEIEIHESCENLIRQLRVGMWKDEKKLDFQRTEGLGHLDGIAALMYFNRAINRHRNPFPADLGLRHSTHFIPPGLREERRDGLDKFANLYKK